MTDKETKKRVRDFLKKRNSAVLCYLSKKKVPQGATIYYAADDELNLYFSTPSDCRKAKDLPSNKTVALVVTDESKLITVQLEGKIKEVKEWRKSSKAPKLLFSVLTNSVWNFPPPVLMPAEGVHIYEIKPTWIRMADFKDVKWIREDGLFHELEF